jgi:hypothetical protein
MAETVTIGGEQYLNRNPLGVLGLSVITLGIYGFYWYYQINDEIRRFEKDDTISPVRSLMAILFGWLIIVPPFIAVWNTANHVLKMQERVGVQGPSRRRSRSSSCWRSPSRSASTCRST